MILNPDTFLHQTRHGTWWYSHTPGRRGTNACAGHSTVFLASKVDVKNIPVVFVSFYIHCHLISFTSLDLFPTNSSFLIAWKNDFFLFHPCHKYFWECDMARQFWSVAGWCFPRWVVLKHILSKSCIVCCDCTWNMRYVTSTDLVLLSPL